MSDQEFDDLVRQLQAVEIEITRCDATVSRLWTGLIGLARLGIAASTEYEQLVEVESEGERLTLLREKIRTVFADAGR